MPLEQARDLWRWSRPPPADTDVPLALPPRTAAAVAGPQSGEPAPDKALMRELNAMYGLHDEADA